jgi:hypothetical protein
MPVKRRLGVAWRSSIWRIVAMLVVALVAGVALHAVALALLVAFAALFAIELWRLAKLSRLVGERRWPSASGNGIWDALQNARRDGQRRRIDEKRRLASALRAFRDAAAALLTPSSRSTKTAASTGSTPPRTICSASSIRTTSARI